jgi:glutathione S-transferase
MTTTGASARLIIHGTPLSQPTRAVVWTCLIKGLSFELRPGSPESPDAFWRGLQDLNPKVQMPVIQDGDFVLYEMPAILCYLADKHGWNDLYPQRLETRALINQYLHFHHTTTRLATFKLQGPHVTVAMGWPDHVGDQSLDPLMVDTIVAVQRSGNPLSVGREAVNRQFPIIENGYFFGDSDYLCGTPGPTIADVACYEELAQLRWAGLFAFVGYPKLAAWLDRMAELPGHDAAHTYNLVLGNIASEPNTPERLMAASQAGIAALVETGARVVPAVAAAAPPREPELAGSEPVAGGLSPPEKGRSRATHVHRPK